MMKIIEEYGLAVFLSLSAMAVIAWVFRVALKNPLEVVSGALKDVEGARQALREEIAHRDTLIAELRREIESLKAHVTELEKEFDDSQVGRNS